MLLLNFQNLLGNCFNIYRCGNLYKSLDIYIIEVYWYIYVNICGNFILIDVIVKRQCFKYMLNYFIRMLRFLVLDLNNKFVVEMYVEIDSLINQDF